MSLTLMINGTEKGSSEIKEMLDEEIKKKELKKLVLISAPLTDIAILSLCECIKDTPLQIFNLTYTFLSEESWEKLFEVLTQHEFIQDVNFNTCHIPENAKFGLIKFIEQSKTLNTLDLTENRFECDEALWDAIKKNKNLMEIKGIKYSQDVEDHLAQNRLLKNFEGKYDMETIKKVIKTINVDNVSKLIENYNKLTSKKQ